jgi:flagellar L-ring protein precursor FlgH
MASKNPVLVGLLLATALVGCGQPHIAPFTPRSRVYQAGKYAASQPEARPREGSLFSDATPGFLQSTRAVGVGDVVVVKIDEQADAKGDATTQLSKSSKRETGVQALLGLVPALKSAHPDIDAAKLLSLASDVDFNGDGATARKGQLTGSIAVRVREKMPNGDLYVEGTKVVMINSEEYHLYISGLVRSADVNADNSVASSRVADAQIEFTGRGDVASTIDRGWLTKALDAINPF